jgi:aldehyde dehydrogenase (NAD+)
MDIDKVAFTGSSMVGKLVHKMAGESNLKRCSLELGGKSPMIVFDDADLEQAVSAAQLGLFLNSGQCCIAGSRLYVQENIYDAFVKLAVEKAQSGQGNWEDQPIVDKMQFEKVMGYIEAGKRDGAVLKCGGKRSRSTGYFIKPTVFANVNEKMLIGHEEIFGPVMSILKFKTIDEVIKRANNSIYGLGAGVCTRDIGKALHVANHMRAGTVYVNCYDKFDTAAPFGGFKESGHGRELGEAGLDNYCENKTIVISVDLPKEVGTSSGSKKSSKKKFESDSEDEDSMLVLTPFANGSSRHDASDDEGQVFKVIKKKKM